MQTKELDKSIAQRNARGEHQTKDTTSGFQKRKGLTQLRYSGCLSVTAASVICADAIAISRRGGLAKTAINIQMTDIQRSTTLSL